MKAKSAVLPGTWAISVIHNFRLSELKIIVLCPPSKKIQSPKILLLAVRDGLRPWATGSHAKFFLSPSLAFYLSSPPLFSIPSLSLLSPVNTARGSVERRAL